MQKTVVIFLFLFLASACEAEHDPGSLNSELGVDTEKIDFEFIKNTVFERADCLNCHSAAVAKGGVRLESYSQLFESTGLMIAGDAEGSRLYQVVATGEMPLIGEPLSDEYILILRDWINSGAPEFIDNNTE